eukprot:TRINITY_DN44173_c0_g1_i1.p1 TRINITY_DN44173_c0_g1~~TRINITY_DN44173_c0_g1_i1.p1  ORF type:complete len:527 (-),score=97.52 TRINITY_DN44173_c0_g1_i1:68-1648(-)
MGRAQAWVSDDRSSTSFTKVLPTTPSDGVHDALKEATSLLETQSARRGACTRIYYKPDSLLGAIVSSRPFEMLTLSVISANAIWLGLDADFNDAKSYAETHVAWIVGENIFCVYFAFEILVRFFAVRDKMSLFRDHRFAFDSSLVVFMIVETWILPIALSSRNRNPLGDIGALHLLRLLRLSRLARIMRSVPELTTIVKGIIDATRSVGTVLLFLILLCYVWAIVFTGTYKDSNLELEFYFGSIGMSMFTFFCNGTLLDDLSELITMLREDSLLMLALFIAFILLAAFTILNMLIGILCDVTSQTKIQETQRKRFDSVKAAFKEAFEQINMDWNGTLSETKFELMCSPGASTQRLLKTELGIGFDSFDELKKLLFTDSLGPRELSFDEFLQLIIRLRPDEEATPLDVQQFSQALRDQDRRVQNLVDEIVQQVGWIRARFDGSLGNIWALGKLKDFCFSSAIGGGSAGVVSAQVNDNGVAVWAGTGPHPKLPEAELLKLCDEASVPELMKELRHRLQFGEGGGFGGG